MNNLVDILLEGNYNQDDSEDMIKQLRDKIFSIQDERYKLLKEKYKGSYKEFEDEINTAKNCLIEFGMQFGFDLSKTLPENQKIYCLTKSKNSKYLNKVYKYIRNSLRGCHGAIARDILHDDYNLILIDKSNPRYQETILHELVHSASYMGLIVKLPKGSRYKLTKIDGLNSNVYYADVSNLNQLFLELEKYYANEDTNRIKKVSTESKFKILDETVTEFITENIIRSLEEDNPFFNKNSKKELLKSAHIYDYSLGLFQAILDDLKQKGISEPESIALNSYFCGGNEFFDTLKEVYGDCVYRKLSKIRNSKTQATNLADIMNVKPTF